MKDGRVIRASPAVSGRVPAAQPALVAAVASAVRRVRPADLQIVRVLLRRLTTGRENSLIVVPPPRERPPRTMARTMSAPGIPVFRTALAAAAVLGAIAPSAAQDRPKPGSSSPSYESSVSLVLVDMRIRRGRDAVPDLRADEVTLLIDGKPRLITSLIYAPVVTAGEDGRVTAPRTAMPANAAATPIPARRVVFVVDRESLESGEARQLQKSTEEFIRRLPAAVGVAVTTLPLGSGIRFEPDRSATILSLRGAFEGTRRRGADIESIGGFGCEGAAASAGCGNQGIDPSIPVGPAREANLAAEWTLRGRKTLDDLKWIFRALAGGPADVVVVSGALPFYESAKQGLRADIERAFTEAQTAGVRVHAVEVTELSRVALPEGAVPPTLRLESLREKRPAAYGLPEETGGVQVVGAVSGADFFKQLSRELSSTYLLSFEPTDADRDGRPHTIEVRNLAHAEAHRSRPKVVRRIRGPYTASAARRRCLAERPGGADPRARPCGRSICVCRDGRGRNPAPHRDATRQRVHRCIRADVVEPGRRGALRPDREALVRRSPETRTRARARLAGRQRRTALAQRHLRGASAPTALGRAARPATGPDVDRVSRRGGGRWQAGARSRGPHPEAVPLGHHQRAGATAAHRGRQRAAQPRVVAQLQHADVPAPDSSPRELGAIRVDDDIAEAVADGPRGLHRRRLPRDRDADHRPHQHRAATSR